MVKNKKKKISIGKKRIIIVNAFLILFLLFGIGYSFLSSSLNLGGNLEVSKVKKFTVTFNANNGTVSETSKSIKPNKSIGILPTPERTGYEFDGWYTEVNGGIKIDPTTVIVSDITYYAHWFNVEYDANGGIFASC